jgi:hypothetical protein
LKAFVSDVQLYGLIRGVLLPSLVAAVLYVLARFVPGRLGMALRAGSVAGAVLLAYILLIGMPAWPVGGSPSGIIAASALAAVWPLLEGAVARRVWMARFLMLAVIAIVVLKPLLASWATLDSVRYLLYATFVGIIAWAVIERGSEQMYPSSTLAVLLVMCAGSAAAIAMGGSLSLGQLAGALAAAVGVAMVLALMQFLRPGFTEMNGAVVALLFAIWLAFGFYTDMNWEKQAPLLAPLAIFVIRSMIGRLGQNKIKDAVWSVLFALIPVAWALYRNYQAATAVPGPG